MEAPGPSAKADLEAKPPVAALAQSDQVGAETNEMEGQAETLSRELFRPKSESGQHPVKRKTQVKDHEMPWWGWKSLGFLFIAWAIFGLLEEVASGPELLEFTLFFGGLFGLHILSAPLFCFYYLYVDDSYRARESMVASGVFFFLGLVFLTILRYFG